MSQEATRTRSDIKGDHWLLRLAPTRARPFLELARLDRPIGTWLLLFPCWWGLTLAAAAEGAWPEWRFALYFAIGALVMRGAGCTFNDIVDRKIDAKVARTATRPLPSGRVSLRGAWIFLCLQLAFGFGVLLAFNTNTVLLALASLVLVASYPFMKRITYWPQAWLGLTFNWGALLGWCAVTGTLDWPAGYLYAAGIAWTLGYDTIYAHQDKDDDALIGVKSTALKFGRTTRSWLAGFYTIALVGFAAAGLESGLGWVFAAALSGVALHFAWQVSTLRIQDAKSCQERFQSNRYVGWILLGGMVCDMALA